MTCQFFSTVCVLCSLFMTSSVRSRIIDTKSRVFPPIIIEGPNFHEYFKPDDDRIYLPCTAVGTDPIEYRWLRNGETLEPNDRVRISDGALVMHNIDKNMEGFYQCFASNDAGVTMSNITFLQAAVLESEQRSRMRTPTVYRSSTDSLTLPCTHVSKSIPPPIFQWESAIEGDFHPQGNFLPVPLDSRVQQMSDGSLVFSFVRVEDSAVYVCKAYNNILRIFLDGSKVKLNIEASDTSALERKLHEPPVLLFKTSDTTTLEGQTFTLSCLFGSWPLGYQVEWRTPSGSIHVSESSSITIRNASVPDEGTYTCTALKTMTVGDQLRSETANVSVKVDAIPVFTIFPTDQEIALGQNATFECQGQGRPSPIVTWYANGTSVDEIKDTVIHFTFFIGRTAFLVLSNVHTTATVTCNISNAHGSRLHTAMIIFAVTDVTSPSSQSQAVQTLKTSTESSSTQLTESSTQQYHRLNIDSNLTFSSRAGNSSKIGASEKPDKFHPTHSSLISNATVITQTSIGVVVGLVVVVAIIISVIIYVRQKKKRRGDPAATQDYRLRQDVLIVNNERVAYDSDDSGFDDLRIENRERRNVRQP